MHVGFYTADQNPHRDRTLGITVYTANLIEELVKHSELRISVLASASSFRPESQSIAVRMLPIRTDHAIRRFIADQLHTFMPGLEVDLWHYPKGFLPLFFQPDVPVIGTVNDVILQFYADRYPRARSAAAYNYWLRMLRRSIPRFAAILTISEFSKNEIQRFCERHKLRCPPITVTYLARQWNRDDRLLPGKEDYVLHLASREPHKRTATLLEFWRLLAPKRSDLPELCLVGQLDPRCERLLGSIERVRVFPRLSEDDLKDKFLRARALIFASEMEGFGLPVLEAYEMRTPVVFAAGTPVREILGPEAPGEFSLDSVESFEAALDTVLALDPPEIEEKATALRQQFSWSRCANETIRVYEALRNQLR